MATHQNSATRDSTAGKSSGVTIALAWTFVGVPLLWGVVMTVIKASALFT